MCSACGHGNHCRRHLRYFANKEDVIEACAQARGQAQEELHPAMEPGAAARLLVAAYVGLLVQKVMDPDVDVPKCAEALSALYRGDCRRGGSPTSDGKS